MNTIPEEKTNVFLNNVILNSSISNSDLNMISKIFNIDKNIIKHFYSSLNSPISMYLNKYIEKTNFNNNYYNMFVNLLEKNKIIYKLIVSNISIEIINKDINESIKVLFEIFKYSSVSQIIHDRIKINKYKENHYDIALLIVLCLLLENNNFDFKCINDNNICKNNFYPLLNKMVLRNEETELNIFKKHLEFIFI